MAVGLIVLLTGTSMVRAQSSDALIDKLVEKGILNVKEAKDLREEADKNFTSAYQVKSGMPEWLASLQWHADLRGRYDKISPDAPGTVDRDRFRVRLRVGATAAMFDDLELGFRLTSAEPAKGNSTGGNPVSGNSTLTGNGSKKFIYIDQAYGKWSPLHTPEWNGSLTIGKMQNPFVFSDIIFDPDYTPEGGAIQLSYAFNDKHALKLIGGGFLLNEVTASSLDSYMFGAQLRFDSMWSTKWQSSLGLAMLNIENRTNLNTALVPNQNVGNTRGTNGNLTYNFYPVIADASLTYNLDKFPLYKGTFPITVFGDYMVNPGAPDGKDTGWSTGITFGKSGKRGTWDLTYRYKHLESDAWYEELVDDDSGGFYPVAPSGGGSGYGAGTNIRGHWVKANYSPYDSLTFGITYFLMDLIDNPKHSVSSEASRFMVDATWKF